MNIRYGSKEFKRDFGELTFGEALQSWRLCEEMSQGEFAKLLGISQASLCDLEKGRRIPSIARAAQIAQKLQVTEVTWIKYALQDALRRENLNYVVTLEDGRVSA